MTTLEIYELTPSHAAMSAAPEPSVTETFAELPNMGHLCQHFGEVIADDTDGAVRRIQLHRRFNPRKEWLTVVTITA